jgi:transcriptional regulator with XRE-family HTH domain
MRVGALFRVVRLRRRLRQLDVGRASRTSQQLVSLLELGQVERVGLTSARRVAAALGIRLELEPRYRGGDAYRLLDAGHAAVVEAIVRRLRRLGWTCEVEFTFNRYGERGSVDILAWRDQGAVIAIIEVKTRVVDVQDTLSALDRKVRVVPQQLRGQRGWRPRAIGRILVLPDTTSNRSAVARHSATLRAVLPGTSRDVLAWLRDSRASIGGVWFLSGTSHVGTKRLTAGQRRARRRRSRSEGPA